jgi:tetratricopeptide (TPR) repeat protein
LLFLHDSEKRRTCYANAGGYIVRNCHALIALWDGQESGKPSGTTEMVTCKLEGKAPLLYPWRTPLLFGAENGPVYIIHTPRAHAVDYSVESSGLKPGACRVRVPQSDRDVPDSVLAWRAGRWQRFWHRRSHTSGNEPADSNELAEWQLFHETCHAVEIYNRDAEHSADQIEERFIKLSELPLWKRGNELRSPDPNDEESLQYLASTLHAMGHDSDYEAVSAESAELAFNRNDDGTTNTAAWLSSMLPESKQNMEALVKLMQKAAKNSPNGYAYRSTLGSILYRIGKYEEAISTLKAAMELRELDNASSPSTPVDLDRNGTAFDWVFLAMSNFRLGRVPEAKKWLQQVTDQYAKIRNDPVYDDPNWNWDWDSSMQLKTLYDEAQRLIKNSDR